MYDPTQEKRPYSQGDAIPSTEIKGALQDLKDYTHVNGSLPFALTGKWKSQENASDN